MESLKRSATETLLNAERPMEKSLLDAASHIEVGDPGEKLLELASASKPDLAVLAALQDSASEKLVRTTSSHFLKSRPYSLLIVP
jgi:nucleotide-binding universal stress UspA family protein